MEDFYRLMASQSWGEILKLAKTQQSTLKNNKLEWERICSFLESEFISYSEREKPVLVSKLCFDYIKLNMAGYIYLTEPALLKIEEIGLKSSELQGDSEAISFAKICRYSSLAKDVINGSKNVKKTSVTSEITQKRTYFPRTDWLNPLFKSSLEYEFYQALKDVFPSYFIYPNVALSNIFEYASISSSLSPEEQSFYFKGVVDFVVYDPADNHMPKFFFEVDSFYHDRPEARLRDEKKDAIFNAASLQLHRIRAESDSLTTKSDFRKKINNIMRLNSL
ncbi:DUF2726 domain-containing protein [Shewanella corallii]|uniref:DUF2726 domain-containing protein n=1 Tax=Shewanella corallii TaxID=560080 RepID=A0ABT0N1K2_9GAMM|nr:DUF2726 domain-containing protein [Shewanella corallii]MCL2912324.1 DUF2726 domain-containing protein [Shewanella corallii]